MKLTSFSNCFEQPSLVWQFASVISSTGISLNTSNQNLVKNYLYKYVNCAIWPLDRSEFVAGQDYWLTTISST